MDFGVFGRTRWQLVAWLLLPPLVVAALYGSFSVGIAYSQAALCRQTQLLEGIPDLERATERADMALLPAREDGAQFKDRLEALSLRINETAELNDMLVTGLGITESSSSMIGDTMLLTVKGQGDMQAVLGFIHGLEQPARLCTVQAVKLETVRYVPEIVHSVEMKVACLVIPRTGAVEGGL